MNIDHNKFETLFLQDVNNPTEYDIFLILKIRNLSHQNNYSHDL